MKKNPFQIKYNNEFGAKLLQFGIDDTILDGDYFINGYGKDAGAWPLLKGTRVHLQGTVPEIVAVYVNEGKGLCYIKCNTDGFYKLKEYYGEKVQKEAQK